MRHLHLPTPVGTLALTCSSVGRLVRVDWLPVFSGSGSPSPDCESLPSPARRLLADLHSYFSTGEPLDAEWVLNEGLETGAWSEFQRAVYRAVLTIPHGETRTYAWVANRIRRPGASRAVGQALRRNQHLILVPCHRVTSAGDIGGFMGLADPDAPELRFKQGLLDWEQILHEPYFCKTTF
jgi:methylated-DNA-[protein]-cysteine S-methyltransferase